MYREKCFLAVLAVFFSSLFVSNNLFTICNGYFFGPEFQVCDSNRLRKYRKNFCTAKLVFTSNTTKVNSDCVCLSGIWMIINRDCDPSMVVSKEGCILSPEIKAMQYLGAVGQEDFFAVVTQSDVNYTYNVLRPVQNAVVNGYVWLFNGVLLASDNGGYCAEKLRHTKTTGKTNEITRYTVYGKLTIQYECYKSYIEMVTAHLRYDLRRPQTSECRLDCRKDPASKLIIKREMKTGPHNKSLKSDQKGVATGSITPSKADVGRNTTEKNLKIPSLGVKSLIHNLHRRLLLKTLTYGFSKDPGIDSKPEYIPQASFTVLNKLRDIVYKSCADKVPKSFLEFAFVMFQAAYENRGTNLMEYITKQEETDILQFLNECHDTVEPLRFNKEYTFCPDEIKYVEKNYEYVTVNFTTNYHPNYYLEDRHLTMEIPWNMIDLTLAMCIQAFAESYILYHKMEQAMEKLFTKDLKILWNHPPEHGTFYTRVYGPNWKHYAENLEKCVQAAYILNPKLTRLRRPNDMEMNLTTKFDLGDFRKLVMGFHMPIPIPEITPVGKRSAEALVTRKTKKSILKSVELTCESLDKQHCFYD